MPARVGGSVLGFAETLSVPAVRIGGNLFGFGQSVETSAAIAQNALVFAERGRRRRAAWTGT